MVIAQIILRAPDGSSILDSEEPPTAATINRYQADEATIKAVSQQLEELGFEVLQTSPTSLTVSGGKSLFEKTFQTTLESRSTSAFEGAAATTYYEASAPFSIPASLAGMVAGVALSTPPQFYP